jgi:hypothetical protein
MAEKQITRHTVRCAVYTRKSTEEGLDQEFNFAPGAARGGRGVH